MAVVLLPPREPGDNWVVFNDQTGDTYVSLTFVNADTVRHRWTLQDRGHYLSPDEMAAAERECAANGNHVEFFPATLE